MPLHRFTKPGFIPVPPSFLRAFLTLQTKGLALLDGNSAPIMDRICDDERIARVLAE